MLPKCLLSDGRRSTGGQRKRYKDSLKSFIKVFEINNESWESLAAVRGIWRSLIRKGAESYEQTNQDTPGGRKESANPLLRKQTLPLLLFFNARTAAYLFVPESALSVTDTSHSCEIPVMSWSLSRMNGRTRRRRRRCMDFV